MYIYIQRSISFSDPVLRSLTGYSWCQESVNRVATVTQYTLQSYTLRPSGCNGTSRRGAGEY